MIRARRASRTFSYSKKLTTSERRILSMVCSGVVVDAKTVGVGENADRVLRGAPGTLIDLQCGERTIRGDPIRRRRLDPLEQGLRNLHRELEELLLHAPGAVHRGTPLDGLDGGAGEPQHVRRARAHVLRPQVTGQLISDLARSVGEAR